MTTKLLPRLVATSALAVGLSAVSAVTGIATSAHASTPAVVTAASNGGIDEHLTYDQVVTAAAGQSSAQQLCKDTFVPAANAIAAGSLPLTTCTTYTHMFAAFLKSRGSAITINYDAGNVTARVG